MISRRRDRRLTCTVLSRTTCDTVSRSCAAIPSFPRPRVNFLSLILANVERRRFTPESIPSDVAAPVTLDRIGHRARTCRGVTGNISYNCTSSQLVTINQDRATNSRLVGHHQWHQWHQCHQSHSVPAAPRCRFSSLSLSLSLNKNQSLRGLFAKEPLLSHTDRYDAENWSALR